MRIATSKCLRLLLILPILIFLFSCGDAEDGGGGGIAPYNPLWVYIDRQYLKPVVITESVDLSGEAYCGDVCPPGEAALGYCPPIDRTLQSPPIDITWNNRTTGAMGNAWHGIYGSCSCLFSYCFTSYSHKWIAYSVPLVVGDNVVEIRAYDALGNSSTDSLAITRMPVTGLNQPGGIAVDTVNDEILVASTGNSAIAVYARTDSGNATPKRIITGVSTGLHFPRGIVMDRYNEILVQNNSSITVYALTASGDTSPIRTITGTSTGLTTPQNIAVDNYNNEIFVTNYGNSSITVYALTASGDVMPVRTISGSSTGLSSPEAVAVDTVNNEIFVANYLGNSLTVYGRTANGNMAPIRTISGANTGLDYPVGIAVDPANNEIFVANRFNSSITVYDRTTGGDAVPIRTISGTSTGLSMPQGIAVDSVNNEIFLTDGNSSILVYPRTASGDAVPIRTITNPTIGL